MTETLDLKKTVNLPKTDFSQKANLAQSEPARLKKWKEDRALRKDRRVASRP
jgi:isoleucyl-tRNA synthetase